MAEYTVTLERINKYLDLTAKASSPLPSLKKKLASEWYALTIPKISSALAWSSVPSSAIMETFATAFADTAYMPVVQCSENDDGRCAICNSQYNTASACKMFTRSGFTSSRSDANNNMVTIWNVV